MDYLKRGNCFVCTERKREHCGRVSQPCFGGQFLPHGATSHHLNFPSIHNRQEMVQLTPIEGVAVKMESLSN